MRDPRIQNDHWLARLATALLFLILWIIAMRLPW